MFGLLIYLIVIGGLLLSFKICFLFDVCGINGLFVISIFYTTLLYLFLSKK